MCSHIGWLRAASHWSTAALASPKSSHLTAHVSSEEVTYDNAGPTLAITGFAAWIGVQSSKNSHETFIDYSKM